MTEMGEALTAAPVARPYLEHPTTSQTPEAEGADCRGVPIEAAAPGRGRDRPRAEAEQAAAMTGRWKARARAGNRLQLQLGLPQRLARRSLLAVLALLAIAAQTWTPPGQKAAPAKDLIAASIADSDAIRPPVPIQSGHLFRRIRPPLEEASA